MNKFYLEILTSFVPSTITILASLTGAYWIFKVREKAVAEGKIFELGREIANILQAKKITGPMELTGYSYIDNACQVVEEKNRDKAIQELLKSNLYFFEIDDENAEKRKQHAAELIIAIATERFQSLAPKNVNWSGRGSFYSPYGVEIKVKDSFFPFGTKLYRQWMENFGVIYNDLWAITNARHRYVDSYLVVHADTRIGVDKKFVEKWLNEVSCRMTKIHALHAKLLTQIQIIDTQVDLPRFSKDVRGLIFYILLFSVAGYFVPKFLMLHEVVSPLNILLLMLATILSLWLLVTKIMSAINPVIDKAMIRKIHLPELMQELQEMKKRYMKYKVIKINNSLSLNADLKLRKGVTNKLLALVEKVEAFNSYTSLMYKDIEKLIEPMKNEFVTDEVNLQSVSVDICELLSDEFNLASVKARVIEENLNFVLSYSEMHTERGLHKIDLRVLTAEDRARLFVSLEKLRESIRFLPIHKTVQVAFSELQVARKEACDAVERVMR